MPKEANGNGYVRWPWFAVFCLSLASLMVSTTVSDDQFTAFEKGLDMRLEMMEKNLLRIEESLNEKVKALM